MKMKTAGVNMHWMTHIYRIYDNYCYFEKAVFLAYKLIIRGVAYDAK